MAGTISFQAYKSGFEGTLIEIRNHESVRTFMTDPREIDLDDHLRWTGRNLDPAPNPENYDRTLTQLAFIMLDKAPQGFVMVRDIRNDSGEVGIMIKDSRELLGLGAVIAVLALEKLCFGFLGLASVTAKASPFNSKVLSLLRGLGGEELDRHDNRHVWFTYKAERCRSNKLYQGIIKRYRSHGELFV